MHLRSGSLAVRADSKMALNKKKTNRLKKKKKTPQKTKA